MSKRFTRGFTLIELLVVIAIIGILSSVVLASLNTARGKGADAAVKSDLNNMRAQAELSYDTSGNTYASVCVDPSVVKAMAGAASALGLGAAAIITNPATAGAANQITCHATSSAGYAIEAPLRAGGFYCVDGTGTSTTTLNSTLGAGDPLCN